MSLALITTTLPFKLFVNLTNVCYTDIQTIPLKGSRL